jgi:hypothetical protein
MGLDSRWMVDFGDVWTLDVECEIVDVSGIGRKLSRRI